MDFNVVDRITLYYDGDNAIDDCVQSFMEYIKSETLSLDIIKKENLKDLYDINGHNCYIAIER